MQDIHNFVVGKNHVLDLDTDECIRWPLYVNGKGYGYKCFASGPQRTRLAHRWVYESVIGPIPPGAHLDHLCRNRACVNPRHLEPVTPRVNNARSLPFRLPKTACSSGHDLTVPGAWQSAGDRKRCRECNAERAARFRASHPNYRRDYMRAWRKRVRPDPLPVAPERVPGRAGDSAT